MSEETREVRQLPRVKGVSNAREVCPECAAKIAPRYADSGVQAHDLGPQSEVFLRVFFESENPHNTGSITIRLSNDAITVDWIGDYRFAGSWDDLLDTLRVADHARADSEEKDALPNIRQRVSRALSVAPSRGEEAEGVTLSIEAAQALLEGVQRYVDMDAVDEHFGLGMNDLSAAIDAARKGGSDA